MPLARGDVDESGDIASQIDQRVELDGRLATSKRRPREQRQAEVDGRRVECVDGLLQGQAEVVGRVEAPSPIDQDLGEIGINPPVARPICIGERAPRDPSAKAGVIELGTVRTQARFDVAQTSRGTSIAHRPCRGIDPGRRSLEPHTRRRTVSRKC